MFAARGKFISPLVAGARESRFLFASLTKGYVQSSSQQRRSLTNFFPASCYSALVYIYAFVVCVNLFPFALQQYDSSLGSAFYMLSLFSFSSGAQWEAARAFSLNGNIAELFPRFFCWCVFMRAAVCCSSAHSFLISSSALKFQSPSPLFVCIKGRASRKVSSLRRPINNNARALSL